METSSTEATGKRRPRGVTRERILDVSLELFNEQGYDKTSLREIAEQLGVTKAALYYHFRTKEEIVGSIVADMVTALDELLAWGQTQPHTLETRQEILRRLATLIGGRLRPLLLFLQRNQAAA